MQMPKQVRQHQKLEKFVGTWVGDEVTHPAPWCPEGSTSVGTMKCKMDMDGWFLRMEYVQRHGRKINFKGMGMIGYDQAEKCYTMAWFDNMGGSADLGPSRGPWKGQKITLSHSSPMGQGRVSYSFARNGSLKFTMEHCMDGEIWAPVMEGRYTRK